MDAPSVTEGGGLCAIVVFGHGYVSMGALWRGHAQAVHVMNKPTHYVTLGASCTVF